LWERVAPDVSQGAGEGSSRPPGDIFDKPAKRDVLVKSEDSEPASAKHIVAFPIAEKLFWFSVQRAIYLHDEACFVAYKSTI
jgi:hypothetical protein